MISFWKSPWFQAKPGSLGYTGWWPGKAVLEPFVVARGLEEVVLVAEHGEGRRALCGLWVTMCRSFISARSASSVDSLSLLPVIGLVRPGVR